MKTDLFLATYFCVTYAWVILLNQWDVHIVFCFTVTQKYFLYTGLSHFMVSKGCLFLRNTSLTSFKKSVFKKFFLIMCVSKLGMSTHTNVVPTLARRGFWILRLWSYSWLWATWCGCWQLNMGPLKNSTCSDC